MSKELIEQAINNLIAASQKASDDCSGQDDWDQLGTATALLYETIAQPVQLIAEPTAWFAFADHNGPVPLELYGWDEKACKHAVLTYARAGKWKGTLEGYLVQQGWTLRPVYTAQPVQPTGDRMAYEGAREDLLDWKRRALESEATARQLARALTGEVNGQTFMGDPAIDIGNAIKPIAQQVQPLFTLNTTQKKWDSLQADGYKVQSLCFERDGKTGSIDAWGKVTWQDAQPVPPAKPFAWCIESTNSADWCFSATEEGVKINALLMDADCIKTAPCPLYKLPTIAQSVRPQTVQQIECWLCRDHPCGSQQTTWSETTAKEWIAAGHDVVALCEAFAHQVPPADGKKDVDISGLQKQVSAYKTLTESLGVRIATLQAGRAEWQEAVNTLSSEREANAMLTDEIAALREAIAQPVPPATIGAVEGLALATYPFRPEPMLYKAVVLAALREAIAQPVTKETS